MSAYAFKKKTWGNKLEPRICNEKRLKIREREILNKK